MGRFYFPIAPYVNHTNVRKKNGGLIIIIQCHKHREKLSLLELPRNRKEFSIGRKKSYAQVGIEEWNKTCPRCTAPNKHLNRLKSYEKVNLKTVMDDPFAHRDFFSTSVAIPSKLAKDLDKNPDKLNLNVEMPSGCGRYQCNTCKRIFLVTLGSLITVMDQIIKNNGLSDEWEKVRRDNKRKRLVETLRVFIKFKKKDTDAYKYIEYVNGLRQKYNKKAIR